MLKNKIKKNIVLRLVNYYSIIFLEEIITKLES
jgi:hypothetical protein